MLEAAYDGWRELPMVLPLRMKFGVFLAPFHEVGRNPTYSLERDMQLIQWLDQLGFDEAWVGEHHSAGWEIISSPEMFLAAVAERTRTIKLGTGVVSLPYHHPLMVANRIVLLDHLSRGRAMLGVGPGALVTDALMLGLDPTVQRQRMDESLSVIMRLLTDPEPLTYEGEWFTLRDATLHLRPFTQPHMPVAVASAVARGHDHGWQARRRGAVARGRLGPARCREPARPVGHSRRRSGQARQDHAPRGVAAGHSGPSG